MTSGSQKNYSFDRSHYLETASALDFKDAAAPRSGQSDVVFCIFSSTNIRRHPACQSSAKMLNKHNFYAFHMKSNYITG